MEHLHRLGCDIELPSLCEYLNVSVLNDRFDRDQMSEIIRSQFGVPATLVVAWKVGVDHRTTRFTVSQTCVRPLLHFVRDFT